LTEAQREQWAVDGYLQLEGALSPAEVDFFSGQIDRVRRQPGYEPAPGKLPRGHYAGSIRPTPIRKPSWIAATCSPITRRSST
jgi:hypothetical protein